MGRDKPKKYNKMGYFQKQAYHDEQAKKYNINKDDFTNSTGGDRYESLDEGAYQKAIKNAMRNDFDYRTSAQHMDGVKGKANFNDFAKYEREAVKLHKQAGNEGDYSSNKDITGVTNNLVKDYQKTLATQSDLDNMSVDNQIADAQESNDSSSSYQESDRLKQAKERVQSFRSASDASAAGNNDEQRNQAASGFAKYKLNLA
jgi:hypothetical protein